MVSFTRKRLQVFVSSTFSDLIDERQAAVEAILTAGHIPAGMELFTSGDESQMEVIKQWIDESDVYLIILGGRYGSIEPKSGKSYTQLEYEYALNQGKPLFACVINDSALEERVKAHGRSHRETDNPQKLKAFRALVLTKLVKFWDDSKDIKIAIGETLSHLARRQDLTGWIRANEEANTPALADEIARLSKENASLRSQIGTTKAAQNVEGLSFREMKIVLESKKLLSLLVKNRILFSDGLVTKNMCTNWEDKVIKATVSQRRYTPNTLENRKKEEDELQRKCKELVIHGLVEIVASITDKEDAYRLTTSGRHFLNMIDADEAQTNK